MEEAEHDLRKAKTRLDQWSEKVDKAPVGSEERKEHRRSEI